MKKMIKYTSEKNGYTGVLFGESSMSIFNPDGVETLHTGSRTINTLEDLKEFVDEVPILMDQIREDL